MNTTRDDLIHAEVCGLGLGVLGVRIFIDRNTIVLSQSAAISLLEAIARCTGKQNPLKAKETPIPAASTKTPDWANEKLAPTTPCNI